MMTLEELRQESKESDGDPHMKHARRDRARAIATNRMLLDVPKATVVIVNPTHYAVALRWDGPRSGAPVCVAKGVDEMAARIRTLAAAAGVPIRHDPPAARALFGVVAVGEEVRREHFAAVAAAIHFAERMRRAARAASAPPR
jgi:flagellar biosynthetic protein FlhB